MENEDILQLWKQYDEKLEKTLSLNQKLVAELQQQKVKKALKPAKNYKLFAIVTGMIYAAMVAFFLYHLSSFASVFLLASVAIHLIVTLVAVVMYINQVMLIEQIDCSENIVQIQQKLASLRASTVRVIGVYLLQMPVFATWNISVKMIKETPLNFWLIQMPIVAVFTFAAIWLYRNVDIKNMDKKWFKIMFCGKEWSSILRSGKLLQEIEGFEKE